MKKCIILFLVAIICTSFGLKAQRNIVNLATFDDKIVHFGFILGYNQFSSHMKLKDPLYFPSNVLSSEVKFQHGFQVGVSGDLRIFEYLRLRLTPTITFGGRKFQYDIIDKQGIPRMDEVNLEATYWETPLEFKIQAKRWKNFRPYLLVGAKHAFDLSSIKRKKLSEEDILVRTENHDWMYTAGVGFDFYLEYFKFGIELKSSFSFKDMLMHENKPYSNPIDYYKTQIFYLNLTFE